MISKFKSFFNKDNFEYSQGLVNPYEFHSFFYLFSKAFLVLDDVPIPRRNHYFHNFLIINTISAIFIATLSLYAGIRSLNIVNIVEGGAYLLLFFHKFLTLYCQKRNIECYHKFFAALREDFQFVCIGEGQKYRERFFRSHLNTWKVCVGCLLFSLSGFTLVICTLIMLGCYLMNHEPGDGSQRPLLFPVWFFDKDISETPFYEFIFTYTSYTAILIGYVYCFTTQMEVMWVREVMVKGDLIIYAIEDLLEDIYPTNNHIERAYFDELLKQRLEKIVKQHYSMYSLLKSFTGVYKKILLYEQLLGGPVICCTSFGIYMKWSSEGELHPVLIILCLATFFVCVLPSYICTVLGEKIRSICDACWNISFWNASPVIRPYLVLIMQRSLRPLPLQASGFDDISLQTFSNKMAAAYSMFNMLRQTNLGSSLNN